MDLNTRLEEDQEAFRFARQTDIRAMANILFGVATNNLSGQVHLEDRELILAKLDDRLTDVNESSKDAICQLIQAMLFPAANSPSVQALCETFKTIERIEMKDDDGLDTGIKLLNFCITIG